MKINCWDFKGCGAREDCQVYSETRLNGEHGGVNAGRACWVVAGTFCNGSVKGLFAKGISSCRQCDFYEHVNKEEESKFKLSVLLLSKLS
ncbi:MAG: hypothetical protein KAR83_10020 [Thermodesulfovibrionales bacterium]|nr:hypothetical protein [Thermodesulfovibrionales bacterium]